MKNLRLENIRLSFEPHVCLAVKRKYVAGLVLLLAFSLAQAATLQVGPTSQYSRPSQAAQAANDGDIIEIASGTYAHDAAIWTKNNLTIRAVGGRAHLDAQGAAAEGKGIWVVKGRNTTIEHIEFSGATVPDRNGAGIRQEGDNLTIRDCYFHDNEDGILTGGSSTSDILIESSEFARNGYGDGLSHNFYIGRIRTFTLRYSYSHDANVGHLVKSRAVTNYILYNRLADSPGGKSSYEIDLPNGGVSYILGNVIRQDANTNNSTIITHAEEGSTADSLQALYFVNNTVVNDRGTGLFIRVANTLVAKEIVNNLFVGAGTVLSAGGISMPIPLNNLQTTLALAKFANPAAQDYHLTNGSPAIDKGIVPGLAGNFSLFPESQYVDPLYYRSRTIFGGALDYGAYEYEVLAPPSLLRLL